MKTDDVPQYPYATGTPFEQATRLSVEMTGDPAANPFTAFDQWKREREAMAQFHDQNQALKILNRKLRVILALADKTIEAVSFDAGLFLKEKTRKLLANFAEERQKVRNTIVLSQEIIDEPPF